MSIKEIVKRHLLEAEMSKAKEIAITKTLEFLSEKWKNVPMDTIKTVYEWFESVKNSFNIQNPQSFISTFLGYFDGRGNREKFDPNNIKVITSYSLPQIMFLWNEYNPRNPIFDVNFKENLSVDEIFYDIIDNKAPSTDTIRKYTTGDGVSDTDRQKLEQLYEKSKALWEGDKHLVFEDSGFRVYNIPDQVTSIAYGWYLYYMRYKYNYSGSNWCTTTPQDNNFFSGKRRDRSFYFIIDESKYPQTNNNFVNNPDVASTYPPNFYLSALQIMKPIMNNIEYRVTGIHNPGEPTYSYDKLIELYPKIKPLLDSDKLIYKPINDNTDLLNKGRNVDPISRITEREGDEYEFAIRPFLEKEEYINRGGVLRKGKSWNSMDKELRKKYSYDTLTVNNMYDKFSNSDLFKSLSVGDKRTLDRKILSLINQNVEGDGISLIIKNIMQNDYYVDARISLNKNHISLYKSRSTSKYGIYNLRDDNWVNHNGITYDDVYNQVTEKLYKTKDGKRYYVFIYSRSSQPNETSFYIVIPQGEIDGYFISAVKWDELKLQMIRDENPENTNVDYDPERDDTDINETNNWV